jgi:hypothetical protein
MYTYINKENKDIKYWRVELNPEWRQRCSESRCLGLLGGRSQHFPLKFKVLNFVWRTKGVSKHLVKDVAKISTNKLSTNWASDNIKNSRLDYYLLRLTWDIKHLSIVFFDLFFHFFHLESILPNFHFFVFPIFAVLLSLSVCSIRK